MGPVSFVIYINDILSSCPYVISYADDTVVVFSVGKNCKEAENKINNYLKTVGDLFILKN